MALGKFFSWLTGDASQDPDVSPALRVVLEKKGALTPLPTGAMATPDAAADAFFTGARDEIERLRKDYASNIGTFGSAMSQPLFAASGPKVEETSSAYTVTLDFAGFAESDIKIEARDKMLAVSAEHRTDRNEGDSAHRVSEHFVSRVQRLVPLDAAIDASTIASTYDGRVLRVTAQKAH